MNIEELKYRVIEDVIVRITLDGSFQRANIYSKSTDIPEPRRTEFRSYLALELNKTLNRISGTKDYNDEDHYKIIQAFSDNVSEKYKLILENEKLRIGVSQKLINLYWKFSWLLKNDIIKPIHCPFDSIVIAQLPKLANQVPWTKMDSIDDYKALIAACHEIPAIHNSSKSIAEWELELYHGKNNYSIKSADH